jgi:predicted RND superfamily exporter protein
MVMSRPSENAIPKSLPVRFLGWIVATVSARPRLMLWFSLLLASASVGVTVIHLQIRTSRADLMDPSSRFAATWKQYSDTFAADNDLLIVVETPAPNATVIKTVIDELGDRLKREPEQFANVQSSVNLTAMRRKALQFLSAPDLRRTAERVRSYDTVVRDQNWNYIRTENLSSSLRKSLVDKQKDGVVPDSTYRSVERFANSLSTFMRHSLESRKPETQSFMPPLPELMDIASDQKLTDDATAYVLNQDKTVGVLQLAAIPQKDDLNGNGKVINRLREHIAIVQAAREADYPGLKISLTGIPALEHDEMHSTSVDMRNAGMVAFIVVGGMLLLTFRGVRHPMLALLTLVVSLAWTFGAATLVVGHLNIISVCFSIFLIGLGIDYSVSFINGYLALRQELFELPEALRETAETTGKGILTSATITALAFSTALVTGFPGLAELGLISGMGVLLSALATFLFLPALIALSDAEVDVESLPQPFSAPMLRRLVVARPIISLSAAAIVLGFFGYQAFRYSDGVLSCRINYDSNLLDLQDQQLDAVKAERRLADSGTETVLYAVSVARTWEDAIALRNRFLNLPTVARVSDGASKLPETPNDQQMQLIRQLQQSASNISRTTPAIAPASHSVVGTEVDALYTAVRKSTNPMAQRAATALDQFLDDLSKTPGRRSSDILTAYNDMVAKWLIDEYADIARSNDFQPVGLRDVPRELKNSYVRVDPDNTQHWALRIYPKNDVWNGAALTAFVEDLRTVDPEVTGVPVQNLESAGRMHTTYASIGLYALAVISMLLLFNYLRPGQKLLTVVPPVAVAAFIGCTLFKRNGTVDPAFLVLICLGLVVFIAAVLDYRNLRDTVLTLVPAFAGSVLMLGIMAFSGLTFNPLNLIALPLVFAIGIDNGIYLVADCRRQIMAGKKSFEPSADMLSSVIVTSLTSIVGFGSLAVASHQGMFSIGILLAVGVASSLIVSLFLMPPILVLVAQHQPAPMAPVRVIRGPEIAADDAAKSQSQQKKKAA